MADQQAIIAEIVLERIQQDAEHGGPEKDDQHSENDWLAILMRHVGLAASDEAKIDLARFRRQMIRVSALALAAVESIDRKAGKTTTLEKTAGQYTPGSGF